MPNTVEPPIAPPAPAHQDDIMRGICYALVAYFMFGVMQAGAKILSQQHSVIEVAFYRNLIAFIPLIIYIALKNKWHILKTRNHGVVIFRGVFGAISLMITFLTFHYLPMADATVILFTAIILTPALAFFMLKEYIGLHRWGAIFIGLLGVIIMVRPSGDAPLIGICIGFLTAFLHAVINVTLRYLKSELPMAVTFSFIACGILIPGLAMPFVAHMPQPDELLLFLLVGISGGIGQFCLTNAFSKAPASLTAMFNYTGLLWAALFDIAIWKNIPDVPLFIGAAIILSANLYIVYRERLAEKRNKKEERRGKK